MTYEQKMQAIQSLTHTMSVSLHMRKPGDWYISPSVEIKKGAMLESATGNGNTPEKAVEDCWQKLTLLPLHEYIVINAFDGKRRAVRWSGFMWSDVQEKVQA